jgi:hypothetical protein
LTFYDVAEAARARGEVAIGHHRPGEVDANDARRMGGIVINPPRAERIAYGEADRVIVLARD